MIEGISKPIKQTVFVWRLTGALINYYTTKEKLQNNKLHSD